MDSAKILDRTLFSFFQDHSGKCSLSVTFPIAINNPSQFNEWHRSRPGGIEAHLNYPCFQVYFMDTKLVLDSGEGQQEAKSLSLQIISDLLRTKFFTVFSGIRFEVYDSRPEFSQLLSSGKRNRMCFEAIGKHATDEREHRNVLGCFRAAVDDYSNNQRNRRYNDRKQQGATEAELHKIFREDCQSLEKICGLGALISPEFTSFKSWKKSHCQTVHKTQLNPWDRAELDLNKSQNQQNVGGQCPEGARGRTRSAPDIGYMLASRNELSARPRSKSTGGARFPMILSSDQEQYFVNTAHTQLRLSSPMREIPDRRTCLTQRIQELTARLILKFHAPIQPCSFYSPPTQPWHSLVLVIPSKNIIGNGLYLMNFGKGVSIDEISESEPRIFQEFDFKLRHVSIGSSKASPNKSADLGVALGCHLSILGLSNPIFLQLNDRKGTVSNFDPAAWFELQYSDSCYSVLPTIAVVKEQLMELGMSFENEHEIAVKIATVQKAGSDKGELAWICEEDTETIF